MSTPGANRFLDCVLHRGGNDTVLLIAVMLFAIVGIPGFILYQILPLIIEYGQVYSLEDFYLYLLFTSILVSLFTYCMASSVVKHHARDVVWMDSLTEYAASQDKVTATMEPLCRKMEGLVNPKLKWYLLAAFIVLAVANIIQASMYLRLYGISFDFEVVISLFVIINLGITDLFVMDRVQKIDAVQTEFTREFCESMLGEQPILEEMVTGIRPHNLLPHAILMIATLGLYALVLSVWSTHILNIHVKSQWAYEEDVLRWMMAKDNLDSIKVVETTDRPGLLQTIYRFF